MDLDLESALDEANGDLLDVDFSACKEDFDNPAPGRYPVKVESAKGDKSKAGNPVLKMVFVVTDGSYGGKLFASPNLTGKAAWKLRKFLKALGRPLAEGEKLNPAPLVGLTAIAEVTEDSAEYSSVDSLLPGGENSTPTDLADLG